MIDWTRPIRRVEGKHPLHYVVVQVREHEDYCVIYYYHADGSPLRVQDPALENYTPKPPTIKFVPDGEPRIFKEGEWLCERLEFFRAVTSTGIHKRQVYKRLVEEPTE